MVNRRAMAVTTIVTACACGMSISAAPRTSADIDTVLARVGERVAAYHRQAQRVLFVETSTVQPIGSNWMPAGFARIVESELRVELEPADGTEPPPVQIVREIRSVNGKPPREKDKQARAGCTDPNPLSSEPLAFLLPANREAFRFTSMRDGKEQGSAALVIDFVSANLKSNPELIDDPRGHDDCVDWSGPLATRGRVWVDPHTYDVLRVDKQLAGLVDVRVPLTLQRKHGLGPWVVLERDDQILRYRSVTFKDPDEVIHLPQSIDSTTAFRGGLQSVRRTDTFSAFRRFLGSGRIIKGTP